MHPNDIQSRHGESKFTRPHIQTFHLISPFTDSYFNNNA